MKLLPKANQCIYHRNKHKLKYLKNSVNNKKVKLITDIPLLKIDVSDVAYMKIQKEPLSPKKELKKSASGSLTRRSLSILTNGVFSPQVFKNHLLFPLSNRSDYNPLDLDAEIDRLRKENIDLRGKLREKRKTGNILELEKDEFQTNITKYNLIIQKLNTIIHKNGSEFDKEVKELIEECNGVIENKE